MPILQSVARVQTGIEATAGNGPRSRTSSVLGLASLCACIGFALGFATTWNLTGGDWDRTYVGANSEVLMMAGLFGGSIGWSFGAFAAWLLPGSSNEPTREESWWLRFCAVGTGAIALLSLQHVVASDIPEVIVGFSMVPPAAALVTLTLLALAQRNRFRRSGAALGTVVAVMVLMATAMRFGSFLPFDQAWLEGWRSAQADAGNFAPNLLATAPRECPDVPADAGDHFDSFGQGTGEARPRWLEGHVPRWLPQGFGLRAWYRRPGGIGGVWVDERCRQVRLVLFEGSPQARRWSRYQVVDRIGEWTISIGLCERVGDTDGPCLEYLAWSPEERGENHGEVLGLALQTFGIGREDGDRIALGIPVTRLDQG